ncbi:MAG: WYL domain-containing protein [Balneolaceae bacterium]|nr:WYL domain-containing protein [Balneolaceae bacterium]
MDNDLSKYIQFEQPVVVEGLQWIQPLVDAVQLKHVVDIAYKSIRGRETKQRAIHPYLLKEYDNRWYVYAFDEKSGEERIFGLDRIHELETNIQRDFRYFTGAREEIFKHIIGVSRFVGEPQDILLKFYYPQSEYILSKSIHQSQQVIEEHGEEITVKLYLRINYELRALLRSYGNRVKVLEPEELAQQIAG